ncbi:MAG: spermidine/putrescine ABC transporter permease [Mesorhizobium amorphae]|nr:MAG: spermidine/putrescine ABC transporter permease [Mesorhizobium amorphae]
MQHRIMPWALVTPALGFTLLFFALPFALIGWVSLSGMDGLWAGLANYRQFFDNPAYWQAMVNSLEVTAIVTVVSVCLAYPFAWILAERVPLRFQRMALLFAILPFWTSYVVRSYSWLLVLSQNGVVNRFLTTTGLAAEPLVLANTRFATVTGFVHFFVMLLTLTIYANLKQLGPNLQKAAADLGASPLQSFIHVLLPLTLPGVMVGAFLSFVLAIGDYVTPQILGGNNELLMPQLIMMQIGRRGDLPLASALSIILMVVVTLAYLVCARWLKLERS